MADFSFLSESDTDEESTVQDLITQAQDLCILEQVSAINCSAFTQSLLPTDLESRFQKLKSFPVTKHNSIPVGGKSNSISYGDEEKITDDKMGSNPKSISESVSSPLHPSEISVQKGNRGSKGKSKHGSGSSPWNSSNSSSESAIFSPFKQKPDEKHRSKRISKSRSFSSSRMDSPSPPRIMGCFWCSPKTKAKTKSKENSGIEFKGGVNLSDNDDFLSDLGSFSKKEQMRKLKKAIKEEEKVCREAEKIVMWAKQASARMTVTGIEDEGELSE